MTPRSEGRESGKKGRSTPRLDRAPGIRNEQTALGRVSLRVSREREVSLPGRGGFSLSCGLADEPAAERVTQGRGRAGASLLRALASRAAEGVTSCARCGSGPGWPPRLGRAGH
ncbi:unnamed protein product [Rangifer tarandus platyrhynchus]|uniref:Uncharacterized protein n=2 Tax=Rangifer tarandus platyrhynchus TaxID=3082113 RepID=A0ACB0EL11_RANTA|nr:unnamed protein product [Rangifer tarandus platyrhynchus]CAI9701345.1 unnamed protein product [Rangifer tarandus platyrhynchus]